MQVLRSRMSTCQTNTGSIYWIQVQLRILLILISCHLAFVLSIKKVSCATFSTVCSLIQLQQKIYVLTEQLKFGLVISIDVVDKHMIDDDRNKSSCFVMYTVLHIVYILSRSKSLLWKLMLKRYMYSPQLVIPV